MRKQEGLRRPEQAIQKDIERSLRDAAHTQTTETIIDAVHAYDANYKALTGRVKETYIALSGLPEQELFPEGADILNIGDPYLKLDIPGVVSIDYETGEQSQFTTDEYALYFQFLPTVVSAQTSIQDWIAVLESPVMQDPQKEAAVNDLRTVEEQLRVFMNEYMPRLKLKDRHAIFDSLRTVQALLQEQFAIDPSFADFYKYVVNFIHSSEDVMLFCDNIDRLYIELMHKERSAELPQDQVAFREAASYIKTTIFPQLFHHSIQDFPRFQQMLEPVFEGLGHVRAPGQFLDSDPQVTNVFYDIWKLKNGLRDAHLYKTAIEPRLEREAFAEGWSDTEYAHQRELAIQRELPPSKREFMDFKIALFPDTPFEDHSFDRIIASWSVTAHIFSSLDTDAYLAIWHECARLLRPGGKAYMWPTGYNGISTDDFLESIVAYAAEGGVVGVGIAEEDDYDTEDYSKIETITSNSPLFADFIRDGGYRRAVHLVVLPPKSRQRMERYQG